MTCGSTAQPGTAGLAARRSGHQERACTAMHSAGPAPAIVLTGFPVYSLGVPRYVHQRDCRGLPSRCPLPASAGMPNSQRIGTPEKTLPPPCAPRGQPCWSSNQVVVWPPSCSNPQRAASASTRCSPRPPPARPHAPGRSAGTVEPLMSVTCTRVTSPTVRTVTVTIRPGSPEALCRTLLVTSSLFTDQEHRRLPCRMPGAEHRGRERAGHCHALRPPGDRHALPSRSAHPGTAPSAPACRPRPQRRPQRPQTRERRGTRPPSTLHSPTTVKPTPAPTPTPDRIPARNRHGPPHRQHAAQATAGPDTRPIRGVEFARLADLHAFGFSARFAQLAADRFPGADTYIRPKSAIGL
jgi:hypothetical protein